MFTQVITDHRQPTIKRAGFTLVELLVVISIIALLVSILMPALGKARAQAKAVVCNSNLSQLGLGMQLYLQDNDDVYVPWYHQNPAVPTDKGYWFSFLVITENAIFYNRNSTEYIGGDEVLFCPAHVLPPSPDNVLYPTAKDYAMRHDGRISYGMNYLIQYNPKNPTKLLRTRPSSIKSSAETILLTDASYQEYGSTQVFGSGFVRPFYNLADLRIPALRHSRATNILWVDGHSSRVKAPEPDLEESIYYQEALTDTSMSYNYWDRN